MLLWIYGNPGMLPEFPPTPGGTHLEEGGDGRAKRGRELVWVAQAGAWCTLQRGATDGFPHLTQPAYCLSGAVGRMPTDA